MNIYRRLAYITLFTLLTLLVVIPTALYAILSTPGGSAWAVQQAQRFIPATISYQAFSGTLTDQFQFTQFRYDSEGLSLQFSEVEIRWEPIALLDQQVKINQLTLGSGSIRLRETQSAQPEQPPTDIRSIGLTLPVAIDLQRLQLQQSWLFLPNAPQQQVSLTGSATLAKNGQLTISSLEANHQYARLAATLSAKLAYPFPYEAQLDLNVTSPDYPSTRLQLASQGNINKLTANYSTADSIALTGDLEASELLNQLAWSANLEADQADLSQWLNNLAGQQVESLTLSGTISANGSRQQANVMPQIELQSNAQSAAIEGDMSITPSQLSLNKLNTKLSGTLTGQASVQGDVDWQSQPAVQLSLNTDQLSYEKLSVNSQFDVQGPLKKLTIKGNSELASTDFDDLKITLDGLLTDSQFKLQALSIADQAGNADVSGQAQINWQDQISVNADISGNLFEQPVELTSRVNADLPYLDVKQFTLRWRSAQITAQGRLAPGNRLSINGQVPDLSKLPGLSSKVSGDINLSGYLEGSLDSLWADLKLRSEQLILAQQRFDQLTATLQGSRQQQSVNLSVRHPMAKLTLALDNQLSDTNGHATINQLSVTAADKNASPIRLQDTVNITYQLDGSQLTSDTLCMLHSSMEQPACLDIALREQVAKLALTVPHFPLQAMNPLLAAASLELRGNASANFDASYHLHEQQVKSLKARLETNNTTLKGLQESFVIDDLTVTAAPLDDKGVALSIQARSNDVGLTTNGKVEMDSYAEDAALTGNISASLEDLRLLQVLVPALSQVRGNADANMTVQGTLGNPIIQPSATANIEQLLLTDTGTLITDTQLEITQQRSSTYHVEGNGSIGAGSFQLNGDYQADAQRLDASFTGTDLQLLDSPKLALSASPDLTLTLADRNIDIRGQVNIPSAKITPPELGNVVTPSSDVIIKQQTAEKARALTSSADIAVTLGDDVQVSAFGFNGRLQGRLDLTQQPRTVTRASGQIGVATGTYEIYGQELTISQGQLIYNGGPVDNPGLNLQVVRSIPEAPNAPDKIGAQVRGTLVEPELTLFSNPAMPDAHVLSYLLLGRAPNSSSESSNLELQAALLVSGDVTDAFTQGLKDTFGFDEVMLDSATNDVNDTSLYIGKYLSPRLYIKYGIGLIESTSSFFLRYQLTDNLWLESNSSTESQGGDLIYSIEK